MIPCWEALFARFLAASGRIPHQQFLKTAVNVKLLLPPRQSRGVSYGTLGPFRRHAYPLRVILARNAVAPMTVGLPSAAEAPLQRNELAKSASSGHERNR